jgi:hypothetical protein
MRLFARSGEGRQIPFAVCIPSKGRADVLAKTFAKMPFLNSPDVFIGHEGTDAEDAAYRPVLRGKECYVLRYENPEGSVAQAREFLRQEIVTRASSYRYVVVTDDNARYTQEALYNLVATAASLPSRGYSKDGHDAWNIVAGMHGTAEHFDRGRISAAKTYGGFRSYHQFSMIFQVYPMDLYKAYRYPPDAYGLDDRHLILWALDLGLPADAFRVAMDAPYTKARYMPGGQGTPIERAIKCGKGIARLAADFPLLVGAKGTFPIAWQTALALRDGKTVDRLAGGAMRKESALVHKKLTIKRRRK